MAGGSPPRHSAGHRNAASAQQVASLKVLRTKGTLEGALVSMDAANVKKQFAIACVARAADVADVRLLPGVRSPMLVQVALLAEALVAEITGERPERTGVKYLPATGPKLSANKHRL